VTQSVRAAGDGNTAYNNVGINVTENGLAPGNLVQSGQVLVAGGVVTGSSAAGDVAVSARNGGLQMAIQANNNQGNSLQPDRCWQCTARYGAYRQHEFCQQYDLRRLMF